MIHGTRKTLNTMLQGVKEDPLNLGEWSQHRFPTNHMKSKKSYFFLSLSGDGGRDEDEDEDEAKDENETKTKKENLGKLLTENLRLLMLTKHHLPL